ncbi:hypothetical protein KY363_00640 [Candidatus Woesearchaeota archaeon]|nr:hypothetical protein [Candidatus Woesearchaeota archaeon]
MPSPEVPVVHKKQNGGFKLKYNGVELWALRYRGKFWVRLYRLDYNIAGQETGREWIEGDIKDADLYDAQVRMDIARKVRERTHKEQFYKRFGDNEEFHLYQLLERYALRNDEEEQNARTGTAPIPRHIKDRLESRIFSDIWRIVLRDNTTEEQAARMLGYEGVFWK